MFDVRSERLDEICEAEAQYFNGTSPIHQDPDQVVQPGFQLPATVWKLMIGCYIIFFGGMAALVAGSGYALFMVAISCLYALIFFVTSAVLANLSGNHDTSPLHRGKALPTWCGPMDRNAVYGQVLVVPAGIALFGAAVALIGAWTS